MRDYDDNRSKQTLTSNNLNPKYLNYASHKGEALTPRKCYLQMERVL